MSDAKAVRFRISWHTWPGRRGEYKVSIPDYEGGEVVEASAYDRVCQERDALRTALADVMEWIDNWGPEFVSDDEWLASDAAARLALAAPGDAS